MSVWSWYFSHREQVLGSGTATEAQRKTFELFGQAYEATDTNVKLDFLQQSRDVAESIGDEAFVLWCDAWRAMRVLDLGDYNASLEILSKAAVHARHPRFNRLPQQIMVNVLLIDRMGDVDPLGSLEKIEQGIAFLEKVSKGDPEHACLYLRSAACSHIRAGDISKARNYLDRLTTIATANASHVQQYFEAEALYHSTLGDWSSALKAADHGLSHETKRVKREVELQLARAASLVHLDSADEAKKPFNRAMRMMKEISPIESHFNWMFQYHIALGDRDAAIQTLLWQQKEVEGKGRFWERAIGTSRLFELYLQNEDQKQAEHWRQQTIIACKDLVDPTPILAVVSDALCQGGE
jgi:tetratricopeptide (TPR) repeat protein